MAFNIGGTISFKNTSAPAFNKLNRDLKRTERQAKKSTRALKGFRLAIGLLAVGTLVQLSKSLIKTIGDLELMFIRLTGVEGGAKKARVTFDRLFKTFGATPFSIDAVTDSFTRLRAAGIKSEDAFKAVQFGADAIAAFGGTSEELKRFSIGLQQVAGKGVLSMEELRQQIGEALPVAMRVFAVESGRSISAVISAVEKGEISAQEFITTLTKGLEKDFGGFAQSLGDTVLGSIQGALSAAKKALFEFSTSNTDVANRLAATFQNIGKATAEWIKTLNQEDVNRFFGMLSQIAAMLMVVLKALALVGNGLLFLSDKINKVQKDWSDFFDILGKGADKVKGLFKDDKLAAPPTGFLSDDAAAKSVEDSATAAKEATNVFTLFGKSIIATKEQASALGARLKAATEKIKQSRRPLEGLGKTATTARSALRAMNKTLDSTMEGATTFPFVKSAGVALAKLDKQLVALEGDKKRLAALRTGDFISPDDVARANELASEIADFESAAAKARKTIAAIRKIGLEKAIAKTDERTKEVLAKFQKLRVGTDQWQDKIAEANEKWRAIGNDIDVAVKAQLALLDAGKQDRTLLDQLLAVKKQINAENEKAVELIRAQKAAHNAVLDIQIKINAAQAQAQIVSLKRETRGALDILTSSDTRDEVEDRRSELNIGILDTKLKIAEINEKLLKATGKQAELLTQQRAAMQGVLTAQQNALAATTEAGRAAREMWLGVRDAMDAAFTDGIKKLIKGTATFAEVTQAAFDKITDAAIDYLIELVKIQFRTAAINALNASGGGGGGGGGGGFNIGSIFSMIGGLFAKGGAFKGNVKPFANGDIVRGPTMFGLAGEAGDEAIMPLTRVGGKLGVQSTGGGGGDNFSITISAIDAQSGSEFLRKNADQIVNTMRSANNLNRGV